MKHPSVMSLTQWQKRFQAWVHRIYTIDIDALPWHRALGLRALRVTLLTLHGVGSDRISTQSSALTYTTLMSLVPLLAIALATLKGLGVHKEFLDQLRGMIANFPPEMITFTEETFKLVEETDFQKIGSIGALALIYVSVIMMSRIEGAFNQVWGVRRQRPLFRRVSNYTSLLVVVPVLMVASITMLARLRLSEFFGVIPFFAYLVPVGGTWIAFSIIYAALPNIKVNLIPALVGGLLSALVWQGWLNFYTYVQPGVTNYNVIYGTLAVIPIFLIWVFGSWLTVLGGAYLTYAIQNQAQLIEEWHLADPSPQTQFRVARLILLDLYACYRLPEATFQQAVFCDHYGVPVNWAAKVITVLHDAGWILPIEDEEEAYVFALDPRQILIGDVAERVWCEGAEMPLPKAQLEEILEAKCASEDHPWQGHKAINIENLFEMHHGFDNPLASGYSEPRSA